MRLGLRQQKLAADCGHWPLYRFRPAGNGRTRQEFVLDSQPPRVPLEAYAYNEIRYKTLVSTNPEDAAAALKAAQDDIEERWRIYDDLAARWPAASGRSYSP